MKVYALVGKSGTGKSYQAVRICRDRKIESIIDDGLFIYGNSTVTGISAKRQPNMVKATKTALFTDDEHMISVRDKINEIDPKSILVIGTSEKMVRLITERLELPQIDEFIRIEDVTTEKDRAEAHKQRYEYGKHVIPAPSFQLKRDFSGYFMDSMNILRTRDRSAAKAFLEKSVVRPTYSYRGDYKISDRVFENIIANVISRNEDIHSVTRVVSVQHKEGIGLGATIYVNEGVKIIPAAEKLQKDIEEKIEYMTAFNVLTIDLNIKGIK